MNEKAGIGEVANGKVQAACSDVVGVVRYLVLVESQKDTQLWARFVTALGVLLWNRVQNGAGTGTAQQSSNGTVDNEEPW